MPGGRWGGFSVFGSSSGRRSIKHDQNDSIKTYRPRSGTATSVSSSTSSSMQQPFPHQQPWTAEAVASLPPPGLSGPGQIVFSPMPPGGAEDQQKPRRYLAFVSSPPSMMRTARNPPALFRPLTAGLYPSPNNSNKQPQQPPVLSDATPHLAPPYVSGAAYHHHQQQQQLVAMMAENNALFLQQHQQTASPSASAQHLLAHPPPAPQERVLMCMDLTDISGPINSPQPMLRLTRPSKRRLAESSAGGNNSFSSNDTAVPPQEKMSLEERLRRERQRLSASSGSLTQFSWTWHEKKSQQNHSGNQVLRLLVPSRGNLYIQDGILLPPPAPPAEENGTGTTNSERRPEAPRCIHDKTNHSPSVDAQLSPDGTMVAWTAEGEIFVQSCGDLCHGEAPVESPDECVASTPSTPIQISFGAVQTAETCVRHGVADFVAQEEMDRYRGFWWHPDSTGILFARVDESGVPPFRILHHDAGSHTSEHASSGVGDTTAQRHAIPYEDHRYPFAGRENPKAQLGYIDVDRESILQSAGSLQNVSSSASDSSNDSIMDMDDPSVPASGTSAAQEAAREKWLKCIWFDSPREASEYLARVHWLPDGSVAAQWQNRTQNVSVLTRMDLRRGKTRTLLTERSEVWINLHHMFKVLSNPVHPDDCIPTEKQVPPMPNPLPDGSFSFLYASERTGYQHLYLYTFAPGIHGEQAVPLRAVSSGDWMVESIVGVDEDKDAVYVTGTFDSVLERHLYALPLVNRRLVAQESLQGAHSSDDINANHATNGVRRGLSKVMHALSGKGGGRNGRVQEAIWSSMRPVRLTIEPGMHSIVMDDECEIFVDTSSDLDRPTSSRIYELPSEIWGSSNRLALKLVYTLFDAIHEDNSLSILGSNQPPLDGLPNGARLLASLPPPELISFPTSDGAETLHASLYRPNPRVFGPGPYPLVCAVYGGPHVQRVNRSWSQCADMRAQRLRSLGFCVVKCDNRGSSRRGIAFESSISRRLGRLEVLDQVAAVRQLTLRGIVDATRVGVYGWSYGGYLAAMCLCRAPDVFSCAVSGAPVTSWDGYDTHYTERYMGHPAENGAGYRESAVFDHVPNMRGKMMIVHGLLDENVHFRHTARLINKLVASGKDYDLLLFPEERHSPRRLRDRIYMEQRISDFFLRQLCASQPQLDMMTAIGHAGIRPVGGHL